MLHHRATTRRAVLGGVGLTGLVTLTATGCDLDPRSVPTPRQPAPAVDADTPLVEGVVAELREVAALVAAVRSTHPQVRRALRPLADLHAAHLATLDTGASAAADAPAPAVPGRPEAALRRVRAREQATQRRLTEAAVEAASGDLARVLAAMSAGTAQALAAFPSTPAGAR